MFFNNFFCAIFIFMAGEQPVKPEVQATKAQPAANPVPVEKPGIMKPMEKVKEMKKDKNTLMLVVIGVLVVLAGVGTGWLMAGKPKGSGSPVASGATVSDKEAGIDVSKQENLDEAEGVLKEGGLNGEGTHHLERDGGPSQNIYLTSTVIDLQSFVDKKVQIWGETNSTQEAGWFMDVVKVKVTE